MTDFQALRRVVEGVLHRHPSLSWLEVYRRFKEVATPEAILALLDDRDRLARRVELAVKLARLIRNPNGHFYDCIPGKRDEPIGERCSRTCQTLAAFDTDRGCNVVGCSGQHARGAHEVAGPDTDRGEG